MSTGRKCDFESIVSQTLEGTTNDQPSHSKDLKIKQLNIIPLNAKDAPHFHYFINICSKEFSLYFGSSVWESIILQAACTEPCIRHAVLAIGAMSRNNYHSQSSEPALEYAMKQYNLALRTLNDALDESARSLQLAILGSIAFIAFEVLWGVDIRARMHLDGALAILRSLSKDDANERKFQNDKSSILAVEKKDYKRIGLGSGTDLEHLTGALSQLSEQVSSFEIFDRSLSGDGVGDST
jgi:hypothetical protein